MQLTLLNNIVIMLSCLKILDFRFTILDFYRNCILTMFIAHC